MGSVISGTVARGMAEQILNTLQEKGLKAFESKSWGLNKWYSKEVYGYDFSRNKSFQSMLDYLVPMIKKGIKDAKFSAGNMNMALKNFIACTIANEVMMLLLNNTGVSASLPNTGIKKDSLGIFYELPQYDSNQVKAFCDAWCRVHESKTISLDTIDKNEQLLLSAVLASKVSDAFGDLDISSIVKNCVLQYQQQEQASNAAQIGLFSDANRANLRAGRQEYTEAEQKKDFEDTIFNKQRK